MNNPQNLLFSRLKSIISLGLFSQERCFRPLIISVSLLYNGSNSPCLSCAETSRPGWSGCSTTNGVFWEQSWSRITSFDLLANLVGMNLNLFSHSPVLFCACMLEGPMKLRKMTPSFSEEQMQYFQWISFGTPLSSWQLTVLLKSHLVLLIRESAMFTNSSKITKIAFLIENSRMRGKLKKIQDEWR